MNFPFTPEQFLNVMSQYNQAIWPMQIIFYLLAGLVIYFIFKESKKANFISYIVAFFWLWIGVAYHLLFFTSINKAAYIFGSLFVLQGIMFLIMGLKKKLSFRFKSDLYGWTGAFFVVFALVIYPILNYVFGHVYPEMPTFGLPCPTTIFTFGILLWTDKKVPKYLLIIPVLWALIGVSAAINFGIWEDLMLVIAGIVGSLMIILRDKK